MISEPTSALTIRSLEVSGADRDVLAHLAELDSGQELDGPVLGAEVEGRLLAAISLVTGEVIADPFSRTSELRAMLKLRASQLEQREAPRRRGARWFGHRSSPALGGAPAGHLVTLQRTS